MDALHLMGVLLGVSFGFFIGSMGFSFVYCTGIMGLTTLFLMNIY